MANLKVNFVGLELKSPIIAGSCGLTSDIVKLQEMERCGVGAVVLKSVFEEQIMQEASQSISDAGYPEEEDYVRNYVRAHTLNQYIGLIKAAKSTLKIPVIASINCVRDGEWVDFACQLENAGADAIELNAFILPLDEFAESTDVENMYFNIVKHVKSQIKIPVIMKLSHYFTNLPAFISKLKAYGADAVTLFNRFYEPDINIENETVGAASVFSMPTDLRTTLRWTGILAGKDSLLQISASTGVHSGEAVVKLLLAGATTVQVCSEMYESGISSLAVMNRFLSSWMVDKSYQTIEDFRRKLSYAEVDNASRYERAQFMKYFSSRE